MGYRAAMAVSVMGLSGVLGRQATLEVDGGCVRLQSSWSSRSIPLAGARVGLGLWMLPGAWAAMGAVLVVQSGKKKLRVGLRDLPLPQDARTVPPERTVDIILEGTHAQTLLSSLLPDARLSSPGGIRPRVFELYPRVTAFQTMRPWLLTIAFLAVVGPLGAMSIGDTQVGGAVMTVVSVVAIVIGIVTTVRQSLRAPLPFLLEVHDRGLTLRDVKNAIVFDSPRNGLTVSPGRHVVRARSYQWSLPTIVLQTPGGKRWTLAVWDQRFAWHHPVPKSRSPRFLVGTPDWLTLLEHLGVGGGTKAM